MFDARQYTIRRLARPFGTEYVVVAGIGRDQSTVLRAKRQFRSKRRVTFTGPDGRPVLHVGASREGSGSAGTSATTNSSGNRGYVVGDGRTESYVGAVARGTESGPVGCWELYGPADGHVGRICGVGRFRRLIPRALQSAVPFTRSVVGAGGEEAGTVSRQWTRRDRVQIDLTPDAHDRVDPRLVIAAVAIGDRSQVVDPA